MAKACPPSRRIGNQNHFTGHLAVATAEKSWRKLAEPIGVCGQKLLVKASNEGVGSLISHFPHFQMLPPLHCERPRQRDDNTARFRWRGGVRA